jgi:hypothetical protein
MRFLLLVLMVISVSGCAVTYTREENFPKFEIAPPKNKVDIETAVTNFTAHLDGGKMGTSHFFGRVEQQTIVGQWKSAGVVGKEVFQKGETWSGDADYEVVLSGRMHGESNVILQIISGLTLMIIPHYVDQNVDITIKRRDVSTGEVKTAQASYRYYQLVSLVHLPFFPFAVASEVKADKRLAASLWCQMSPEDCASREPPSASW